MSHKFMSEEWKREDQARALNRARAHVAVYLRDSERLVDGIQEHYDTWDEDTPYIQDVERMEWSNDLGGIELMEELHRKGELSAEHSVRLEKVLAKLKESRPLLEEMRLNLPEFWK